MPLERVRQDDQFRDSTAKPEPQIGNIPNVEELAADEIPITDPTAISNTLSFTVPSAGATAALASTPAFTIPDDAVTVTSVTYTPAGTQAAPSAGNSRTWTLTGSEGTIAAFTESSVAAGFTSGTPITFVISHASILEDEVLNLASAVVGTGFADPGGVLRLTYSV